ncbi:alpha/beta fold hydrolase [Jatrophihabitans sp.]|uniref:alpha/beta fold hydrolase n=1 Tax=Jatrophihabitans sp. TaxID=1932789 RepID=UPI0030C72E56|nr:alpha/beta hydrolase [Jatrophihabitans sp.]
MPSLSSNGATVAYSDSGAPAANPQAPTIVFGHGLLFSGWMFTDQITALQSEYRCVAIDWRGQGASPAASGGYDMDTLSLDAIAVIEALGVGPVHYVGLSMGGFVGMRVAARRPELLRSLTLLDTSADPEVPLAAIQDKLLARIFQFTGLGLVKGAVLKIMFGPAFLASPRSAGVIAEWTAQVDQADRGAIRQAVLGVANRKGIAAELAAITTATLVVVGEQDKPTPPERARRIAAAVAGARLELVADSGHSSSIEQPEVITELIRTFVGEH